VLGLIDVRGQAVPVLDFRLKLGLPRIEATATSRIVVLEISEEDRMIALGLLVDRVFEVSGLDGGALEPPPSVGSKWRSDSIAGIGRRGEAFVVVLEVSRFLSRDDSALIDECSPKIAA
jgi:purine-binding chemotaxis protein CheW